MEVWREAVHISQPELGEPSQRALTIRQQPDGQRDRRTHDWAVPPQHAPASSAPSAPTIDNFIPNSVISRFHGARGDEAIHIFAEGAVVLIWVAVLVESGDHKPGCELTADLVLQRVAELERL